MLQGWLEESSGLRFLVKTSNSFIYFGCNIVVCSAGFELGRYLGVGDHKPISDRV